LAACAQQAHTTAATAKDIVHVRARRIGLLLLPASSFSPMKVPEAVEVRKADHADDFEPALARSQLPGVE
jgi:hypothetical protein